MGTQPPADLLLINTIVLTMDPERPTASFVAIIEDRIAGVGDRVEAGAFRGPNTAEFDCQGMALLPGFNDAHCHLMALGSSLRGTDCRWQKASSVAQIVEVIKRNARETASPEWVRAFGYDEFYLEEKRHPNRWDLDGAAPHVPVRLDHRTGHATVLNSRALDLLEISRDTPDPADGVIERRGDGEPTGVLFEMSGYIRDRVGHRGDDEGSLEGIKRANNLLVSRGITSIQDAGPTNDFQRWLGFRRLKEKGYLVPRVSMMVGASRTQSALAEGLAPGGGDHELRAGAVKLMLTLTTGTLYPPIEELREVVLRTHIGGYQLAIHAVEEEAVDAALDALLLAQASHPRPRARHRIEHCSECPPRLLGKLKASRALVVTQPSFVHDNGDKYLALVEGGTLPHLYPLRSFREAGILVAAGSDAPVSEPDPLLGVASSVVRKTRGGADLGPKQRVSVESALRSHTIDSAYAAFDEKEKGTITTGKLADLVLLDRDPTSVAPEEIADIRVRMTIVGGAVVWQG